LKYVALGGTLCRTRFGRGYELVVGEFRPTAVSILVITYRGGLAPGERMRGSYDLRRLRWQGRRLRDYSELWRERPSRKSVKCRGTKKNIC
jgi:hypothetical protein